MNLKRHLFYSVSLLIVTLAVIATLFLTLNVWHSGDGDVVEYQQYAQAFWWRNPPFQTLPREYPPFALLPFSVTLLAGHGSPQLIFGACMGGLFLLGYLAFSRFSSRDRGLWYAGYLLVGAQGLLLSRYDLLPALLTLGALWATQRQRFNAAYGLLALGTLLKLYPIALIPIVLTQHTWALYVDMPLMERTEKQTVSQWPRRILWPLTYTIAPWVGLLVAGVAALLLGGQGPLSVITYLGARPIQVESFPATLLWLHTWGGMPIHVSNSFGSDNWDDNGRFAMLLATLSPFALMVGCLVVYWRLAWRRISVGNAFLACICIMLVTSKLFSAQYVIWALPLVATVEGGSFVWVSICLLTFVDYPLIYPFNQPDYTLPWAKVFMLVVAVRNALLLYVIARQVFSSRAGTVKKWRALLSREFVATENTSQ